MELNERKLKIMQAIVDDYIASGMPVGSRTISRMWGGQLSPATIRNEMSDLEEMGFLQQPHTSAGRIPSDMAYRLYVDKFLHVPRLSGEEVARIQSYFGGRMREVDDVIATTAHALSDMTDYVAMALRPQIERVTFRQIRLIPVTPGRALAVLVTSEGIVRDVMIDVPPEMDERHLDTISGFLTEHMRGRTMEEFGEVTKQFRSQLSVQEQVFLSLLKSIEQPARSEYARNVIFDGRQNLFKHPEYTDIARAKSFLETMDARDIFYDMLTRARDVQVTISIGRENQYEALSDTSIVTATYTIGGKQVGSFGVIGPTRMDYARVIAIMQTISHSLGQILSGYDNQPKEGNRE